jgi:hypothetical protein
MKINLKKDIIRMIKSKFFKQITILEEIESSYFKLKFKQMTF